MASRENDLLLTIFRKFMVSLHVESLFTNLALKECTDFSAGNHNLKLSAPELRSPFTIATPPPPFTNSLAIQRFFPAMIKQMG